MSTKKADFIWLNGNIIKWETAKISVMTHALHYGTSVFEGIRCYNSYKGPAIFRHIDHIERLFNSAKIYRLPLKFSMQEIIHAVNSIIKINNLVEAYIRILVFIGDVGLGIHPPKDYCTDIMISAFPWDNYLNTNKINQGIDTMISSWHKVQPNTISNIAKASGNYLSSLLIGSEARRHGYHEGIALNHLGFVAEGAGENVFIIKNHILFTPPITSSILPGITRDSILKIAKLLHITIKESYLLRESLYLADEMFLTGTAAEITPVRSIDDILINNGEIGKYTQIIQKHFFNLFKGKIYDQWNWLDYIH
ncbi:branched-chain amino acid transaminase [Enterobacteriaceae endosymbiont of Neohaemonia nigricornis]|uniref:branched-chain amino acid transaminase n=1 Tax=Enterobacteriaceae endosymbiont of Neohaemonia nigricornis TaxID=2675792 RepID=UPI001449498A|nr:branched-chain amino acid transaminase [Enterobacteriaceae endosymbiont of Neohaemonia nigricornis]QJC30380.1 branched-chain amino acid transaminase [Enterobacteriaceae endosymbiont of Neohaemonia nigricornis]